MAKTITPTVPAVAPLTGVEDAATRQALQALNDAHTTRNSGGDEGFVTRGELSEAVPQIIIEGLSASGGSVAGSGSGANWWGMAQAEFERSIFSSLAYQKINQGIEWLDASNNLSLKRIAELADGFSSERSERIEGDSALLTQYNAMKVTVAGNTAAMLEEQTVRATVDSALAQDIETLDSRVNDNSATIQINQETQANWNTATAMQLTTLQAGVAGNTAAIQTETQARATLEGNLEATWTVRANAYGHVAGVALGVEGSGGTATSAFIVQADKFAFVLPGVTARVPFGIDASGVYFNGRVQFSNVVGAGDLAALDSLSYSAITGTKPPTNADNTASNTAYDTSRVAGTTASTVRDNAATGASAAGTVNNWVRPSTTLIDGSKIYTGDAYVDTLQIKGNAVTVPAVGSQGGDIGGNGAFRDICSVTLSNSGNSSAMNVVVIAAGFLGYTAGVKTTSFRILQDGSVLRSTGNITADFVSTPVISTYATIPAGGSSTFTFQWLGENGTVFMSGANIIAQGAKR
ncbi:phage tail tip fiber protein [Thauera aromatica]|uniref:phage tail tip fiber protein n=1 Tax=Thauera aromatica TaxID=59405 RepID=UPI001FFD8725|nr:DUF1983 domain-containing protein [Thauera aromatica]MCK2097659.1 DUF1983 domain-containing protein [Thauera aromatica]